ncbi:uncharacterized protein LOC135482551 isoform X1 [Lineus longissimus]|uniref:uncharacterized protein LOC135482551 isoform X1 n=1 Tax=Lineus longissimus TaxID=88925 RepID=UPI00315D314C
MMLSSPEIPWVAHGFQSGGRDTQRKHFCNPVVDMHSNVIICSTGNQDGTLIRQKIPSLKTGAQYRARVKSATVRMIENVPAPPRAGSARRRPWSATAAMSKSMDTSRPQSVQRARSAANSRPGSGRPRSARLKNTGTMRHPSYGDSGIQTGSNVRKLYSAMSNYTDEERHDMQNFQPDPDHRYFSRHSRCHNQDHLHRQLVQSVPQTACEDCGASCPSNNYAFRAPSNPTLAELFQEYMTRPRTAPATRKEFEQVPKYSNITRGNTPHFCNFVRKLKLHERYDLSSPRVRQAFGSNDDLDDLDALSLKSVGSRSSRSTKVSGRSGGVQGRPGSPSDEGDLEDEYSSKIDVTVKTPTPVRAPGSGSAGSDSDGKSRKASSKLGGKSDTNSRSKSTGLSETISVPGGSRDEGGTPLPPGEPLAGWQDKKPTRKCHGTKNDKNTFNLSGGKGKGDGDGTGKGKNVKIIVKKERKTYERMRPGQDNPKIEVQGEDKGNGKRDGDGSSEEEDYRMVVIRSSIFSDSDEEVEEHVQGQSEPVDPLKVSPKLPEVPPPKLKESDKEKKTPRLSDRQPIALNQDPFKVDPADHLDYELKMRRKEFEMMAADALNTSVYKGSGGGNSFNQGRLALSKQSSRFELPMDMRVLETMSPQEYLRQYCIISSRRKTLYAKIFMKHKDGKLGVLTQRDLEKAIKDVLINTISQEMVEKIFNMVGINEEVHVDQKLFAGIAAFAERILYSQFVTEDTVDLPDRQKEKIECADFCSLNWKFHGLTIHPEIERLLRCL